jgi:hypothetical protein
VLIGIATHNQAAKPVFSLPAGHELGRSCAHCRVLAEAVMVSRLSRSRSSFQQMFPVTLFNRSMPRCAGTCTMGRIT